MTSLGNIRIYTRFYDQKGLPWAVVIWDRNYSGEAKEVPMGSTPITVRWSGDGLKPIVGSEATLTYVSNEDMTWLRNAALDDLLVCVWKNPLVGEDDWSVIFKDYRSVTDEERQYIWWVGFVLTDTYSRELKINATYTIQASDRIGNLENFDYAYNGTIYTNRSEKVINVISKCFAAIRLRLPIVSAINLYEETMDREGTNDPSDQLYIDEFAFLDEEMEPNSVYEVLEKICLTFNCRIYQSGAKWWIARNQEFKYPVLKYPDWGTNPSIAYRVFKYASQDYDSSNTDLTVWFNSVYDPRLFVGKDENWKIIFCGTEESTPGYRNVKIIQNYGKRPNLLLGGLSLQMDLSILFLIR
jgi:hypothetical protein